MPCPTCDHTMSRLGCQYSECAGSWACPRCGTLKIGHEDGHIDIITPALVARCREFIARLGNNHNYPNGLWPLEVRGFWHSLGIAEPIHPPERPEHTEEELKGGTE